MTVCRRFGFLVLAMTVFSVSMLGARPPQDGAPSSSSPGVNPPPSGNSSPPGAAMSDMPGMSPSAPVAAPVEHPWCQDNVWSIFNHRVSGWFLVVWGLGAFAAGMEWPRRTWRRYVGPMALFGLAEFLFFRNDPEAWPVGSISFWASLHDPENLQHMIFLLLIILIALVAARLRESFGPPARLDMPGLTLVAASALALVWGLIRGNQLGWASTEVIGALALGILFAIAFVTFERRSNTPMIPMRLFASRPFAAGVTSSFLFYAAMYAVAFFLPQFLQVGQGYGPLGAGLRMLPWSATLFVVAPIGGALVNRIGERAPVVVGVMLQAIGFADEHSFRLPLTQELLADALGLSVQYVNQTLRQLREEDLVTVERHQVTIHNYEALTALADFERTYINRFRMAEFNAENWLDAEVPNLTTGTRQAP